MDPNVVSSLQYSNLYHQNEINEKLDINLYQQKQHKGEDVSKCDGKEHQQLTFNPEVMYSVIKKPKKSKSR